MPVSTSRTIDKRLLKLMEYGILPENYSMFSEEQKQVQEKIVSGNVSEMDNLVFEHLNLANEKTKRHFIYQKIRHKKNNRVDKGIHIDIQPEDIILNEYCPFFKTKLNYNRIKGKGSTFKDPYSFSIDRIDNSKGYIKGNVIIISRLANTMKRDATISELKTFCKNVILLYKSRYS